MVSPWTLSSVASLAVRKMIGTLCPPALSRLSTSMPSMSGSITSRMTRAGENWGTAVSAARPVAAVLTVKPSYRSAIASSSVMFGSSSTTRTRAPFADWPCGRSVSVLTRPCCLESLGVCWDGPMNSIRNGWCGPSRDSVNVALAVDQPGRERVGLQPGDRPFAHHDGRCGGDIGVDACAGDDGRRSPRAGGRQSGRRVDDVVKDDTASSPVAHSRARRRDPAGLDADRLFLIVDARVAVLARLHRPPLERRLACHRDVTAEAHQGAARTHCLERCGRGQVCSKSLGRRPEIDLDAGREAHHPRAFVEIDRLPPWHMT